jgi:predicted dithiol-disulfide oxidoreductase (DUF899 family)
MSMPPEWRSGPNDFNHEFDVAFTPEAQAKGEVYYNYAQRSLLAQEAPRLSVFYRGDAGHVFHTYSTYGRGVEAMIGTYNLLDLTPKGHDEKDVAYKMEWVRHHDRYEPVPPSRRRPR